MVRLSNVSQETFDKLLMSSQSVFFADSGPRISGKTLSFNIKAIESSSHNLDGSVIPFYIKLFIVFV